MKNGFQVSLFKAEDAKFIALPSENSLITFSQDNTTQNTIIFIGKIYYKNALKIFCPQAFYPNSSSEASIALALFQQKGIEGLKQIEGEFALVIFDHKNQSLIALRDPLGQYPLYWTFQNQTLTISTHLQKLAQQQKSSINRDFLASFLMFHFAFVELATEQTAFAGIQRIPPGTCLELFPSGSVQQRWKWQWEEKIQPIAKISHPEASTQFLHIFRQSIQERIQGEKVAAHLSGGMDSSSIVCLARDLVTEGSLSTVSLVYQLPSLAKETDYINLIIDQNNAIAPHFVNGDTALDFQWFPQEIPEHDEPYPALFHLAMEKILVDLAADLGVTTILSGGGAELVLEGNRYHLADLLHQGQWQPALQLARQWAQAKNESLWSIFFELAIAPLLPAALHQGIPTLFRQGYGRWPNLRDFSIPPWINPDFAKEYRMRDKALTNLRQMHRYPVEQSFNRLGLQTAIGNWASWYLAHPVGLRISQPFLDPRLIIYCLSLPREFREAPGVVKPLLQSAMQGILPEAIRTRRVKANFNEVYWKGLSRQLPQLKAMVEESAIDELGIFDKKQLIEVMRQHALGIGDVRSGSRISTSLAVIAWFDRLL